MPFTHAYANTVGDLIFRNQAFTAPTTVYVALVTTTPTQTAAGTEVSGGSYARQAATFSAFASSASSNSATVTFPTATADWGTVTHFEVYTASTAGTRIGYGALTSSRNITNGTTASFAGTTLTITFS